MYLFYFFFEYKNVELWIIQSYHPLSNIIGKPVSKDLPYWYVPQIWSNVSIHLDFRLH